VENNRAKKTMLFWIFTGVVAIVSSQIPMFLHKGQITEQPERQGQPQQKRKVKWWLLALVIILFVVALWIFE